MAATFKNQARFDEVTSEADDTGLSILADPLPVRPSRHQTAQASKDFRQPNKFVRQRVLHLEGAKEALPGRVDLERAGKGGRRSGLGPVGGARLPGAPQHVEEAVTAALAKIKAADRLKEREAMAKDSELLVKDFDEMEVAYEKTKGLGGLVEKAAAAAMNRRGARFAPPFRAGWAFAAAPIRARLARAPAPAPVPTRGGRPWSAPATTSVPARAATWSG